jgi:calcineurin-like phosphoesterase family protein
MFPAYDQGVVRVLAVSDVVEDALWADVRAVRGAELIIGCGDLPFEYLGHLMNALDAPLVFVPGNHDPDVSGYRTSRAGLTLRAGIPARQPWPDGALSADGAIVDIAGLRVAGLGGCRRYSHGPNQYTDRQQARRARWLALRALARRPRQGRRVDVLLSHAPPRGVGDGADPPHQGFTALNTLVARLRPAVLLHGHVDPDAQAGRHREIGSTVVRNVTGWQLLNIEPDTGTIGDWQARRPVAGQPGPGQHSAGQQSAGQYRAR